jgi:hypothetical protein
MTLSERITELDRLYLAWDAAWVRLMKARGATNRARLRRAVGRARRRYEALRDSGRGLPVGCRRAVVGDRP